jgi:hypothetical protein
LIEAELTDAAALAQHGIKKFKNIGPCKYFCVTARG